MNTTEFTHEIWFKGKRLPQNDLVIEMLCAHAIATCEDNFPRVVMLESLLSDMADFYLRGNQ